MEIKDDTIDVSDHFGDRLPDNTTVVVDIENGGYLVQCQCVEIGVRTEDEVLALIDTFKQNDELQNAVDAWSREAEYFKHHVTTKHNFDWGPDGKFTFPDGSFWEKP